jgi:signal recognition particle subunit SRP68
MKKAVHYAEILEGLTTCTKGMPVEGQEEEEKAADMPVDEHTRMEARAYASWMRGNLAMEREDWRMACEEYQVAFTLCETIAGTGDGEDKMQQLEMQDFFTTRANNVIAPLLRYCQYELQEKGGSADNSVGVTTTLQTPTTSGSTIVFRDNSISVESKELKMALLKVSDLKKEWQDDNSNNSDDAKFMALLNGYDDIISLTNQESKQLASLKSGPAVNAKKFQLVNIMGYAKYQKLKLVMQRNEDLVNGILKRRNKKKEMTLKHLEEVAHLYDALLQDARVIASLPGGGSVDDFGGDSSSVEDEFLLEAKANILRLRSLRCYYLARMHASPLVGKHSQAVALLDQAEKLAREALEEIGACDQMEGRDEILERLESVVEEMKGEKSRVFAVSYLSKTGSSKSSLPLLQRLHDYDIPATPAYLTDIPPKLEPIACKPSFFDVALNYVSDYPVEELDRVLEAHGEKAASSGLMGWFRRS